MKVLLFLLPTILLVSGSPLADEFQGCEKEGNFTISPNNCTHYISCKETVEPGKFNQTIESCETGTGFTTGFTDGSGICEVGHDCTVPDNAEDSTTTTTEVPTTTTEAPLTCPLEAYECVKNETATTQINYLTSCYTDCEIFIYCEWNGSNYHGHVFQCPHNLHFCEEMQRCEYPYTTNMTFQCVDYFPIKKTADEVPPTVLSRFSKFFWHLKPYYSNY